MTYRLHLTDDKVLRQIYQIVLFQGPKYCTISSWQPAAKLPRALCNASWKRG